MKNMTSGQQAEEKAASYLKSNGYNVVHKNWRNRYCEIDIIAQKMDHIYFVEVKYRNRNSWGGGLDYITPQKVKQMSFAAENWVAENKWQGPFSLAVIELSGDSFEVTAFLHDL